MPVQIYNSLTKKKEVLVPLQGNRINIYSCGVTVYDRCHIGHARSLYVFDVMVRYLRYQGYDVRFVRNITDVDDKIINKANELKKTSQEVAFENIQKYYEDLESLSIDRADKEPCATENIPDMIKHIGVLIEKGFAYVANGDVYFSVRKFPSYGKLSGQGIEQMHEAVRIEKDPNKKDPLDFALWKKSKEGEPFWDSPWGKGRPGWHIECSVMSLKHLGCETLDIHAGGRDLIFPHHENEIAQAEALTNKPFARHWIHHGLITINGQKMAKSLGNFVTIQDALKKFSPDEIKMFFLGAHYASPIDFSESAVKEAGEALQRFDVLFWRAYELTKEKDVETKEADFIKKHREDFFKAMDDDFNTPQALAALFKLVSDTNKYIDHNKSDRDYLNIVFTAVDTIEDLGRNVFGLFLKEKERSLSEVEELLLEERKTARAKKDFKRSDELRELLKNKGIAVEDTKEGQVWRWI
ncbi:MAG TPA: cysteine--tRNA ligase [Candidatus Omnitrophota bacterium]|nr:cysteine--tRNA ligase [Candidatus Omnitrophota bacterium]HPD84781.1 cysteine--tRNA ligase [Candidatus Omnitrophota bacterium]HRZ03639.1 cysteine--tRNA ligase [Candidatus Omnitrophota bacterium]